VWPTPGPSVPGSAAPCFAARAAAPRSAACAAAPRFAACAVAPCFAARAVDGARAAWRYATRRRAIPRRTAVGKIFRPHTIFRDASGPDTVVRRVIVLGAFLLAAIPAAALTIVAPPAHAQDTLRVTYDDGRPDEEMASFTLPSDKGVQFLRANDVARLFRATEFWNASSRKVVLGIEATRMVLTVGTRVVVVDGQPVMMHATVRYDGGFVLVPLEFVLEVATHYTPRTFVWNEKARVLNVRGMAYNVRGVEFGTAKNRTTAAIDLTEPLLYHMDASTPGLVRLKIYGGRVDTRSFASHDRHGMVLGMRAEQTDRDAYVYFDINRSVRRIGVARGKGDTPQLIVTLQRGELPEIPEPDLEGREVVDIVNDTALERRKFKIKRVCIDPGHGGEDSGKIGVNGLEEKNVNLSLAFVTKRKLEKELGLEVVLTRTDDRLLSLSERTEIANTSGSDLFLSIHCNSWFGEHAGGFEVYFLAPARSESEKALSRYENAADTQPRSGSDGDVEFILWDLVQNEYINESSTFAEFIQRAMDGRLGIRSRGVKQANFRVLQGAKMPAVLVETAYLSNPAQARMLGDPAFQERVADGIVQAIRQMRERYR